MIALILIISIKDKFLDFIVNDKFILNIKLHFRIFYGQKV
jgi:hypothetical protein